MKWLTKIGQVILKATEIAAGLRPLLPEQAQGPATVAINDLEKIEAVIVSVEATGQALGIPGPDKLKAAAPQVAQILLKAASLGGHEVANQALFAQGAQKIADGMADVLNSRKA